MYRVVETVQEWQTVGDAGFSLGETRYTSLYVYDGTQEQPSSCTERFHDESGSCDHDRTVACTIRTNLMQEWIH